MNQNHMTRQIFRNSHRLAAAIGRTALLTSLVFAAEKAPLKQQGSGNGIPAADGPRAAASAPAPLPRVGVLAYCPSPDARYSPNNAVGALTSDGRFGPVTLMPANETLPSAATLKGSFDCVVAITDLGCGVPMPDSIADSAANALAGYAGSGGGVVLTSFGFAQPRPSLGLGAAIFAPGLSPLTGHSIYNIYPGYVKTAAMSPAPACAKVIQGVSGDIVSSFGNETSLNSGSTACATYYSGLPAVALNESGNVVGFNGFPSAAVDIAQPGYRRLFANSVYQACTAPSAPPETVTVPVDIKPASCPNVLQPASKGVLPVAILGTPDMPVTKIDVASIRLAGAAPRQYSLADVGRPFAPFVGKTACTACNSSGGDGILDLELKFDTEALAVNLPSGAVDACVVLKLTANLKAEFGGGAVIGEDVVSLKGK